MSLTWTNGLMNEWELKMQSRFESDMRCVFSITRSFQPSRSPSVKSHLLPHWFKSNSYPFVVISQNYLTGTLIYVQDEWKSLCYSSDYLIVFFFFWLCVFSVDVCVEGLISLVMAEKAEKLGLIENKHLMSLSNFNCIFISQARWSI